MSNKEEILDHLSNINEDDLLQVTGGINVSDCYSYKTEAECNENFECIWRERAKGSNSYCGLMSPL